MNSTCLIDSTCQKEPTQQPISPPMQAPPLPAEVPSSLQEIMTPRNGAAGGVNYGAPIGNPLDEYANGIRMLETCLTGLNHLSRGEFKQEGANALFLLIAQLLTRHSGGKIANLLTTAIEKIRLDRNPGFVRVILFYSEKTAAFAFKRHPQLVAGYGNEQITPREAEVYANALANHMPGGRALRMQVAQQLFGNLPNGQHVYENSTERRILYAVKELMQNKGLSFCDAFKELARKPGAQLGHFYQIAGVLKLDHLLNPILFKGQR